MARHDVARAQRTLADPQTQAFSERGGFRQIAEAASGAIAGRLLPLMLRDDG